MRDCLEEQGCFKGSWITWKLTSAWLTTHASYNLEVPHESSLWNLQAAQLIETTLFPATVCSFWNHGAWSCEPFNFGEFLEPCLFRWALYVSLCPRREHLCGSLAAEQGVGGEKTKRLVMAWSHGNRMSRRWDAGRDGHWGQNRRGAGNGCSVWLPWDGVCSYNQRADCLRAYSKISLHCLWFCLG